MIVGGCSISLLRLNIEVSTISKVESSEEEVEEEEEVVVVEEIF
jgi:hypothetical protein